MHTVASILWILVAPAIVAMLFSFGLFAVSFWMKRWPPILSRRPYSKVAAASIGISPDDPTRPYAERLVGLARRLLEIGTNQPEEIDKSIEKLFPTPSLSGARSPSAFSFIAETSKKLFSAWDLFSAGALRAFSFIAVVIGILFSLWFATYHLYTPMVSEAYQSLYEAYCTSDAVAAVLAKGIGSSRFPVLGQDACLEQSPAGGEKTTEEASASGLTQQDLFNLLQSFGMLDGKEKTPSDLFDKGKNTKNYYLACILSEKAVYTGGTPTARLIVRLGEHIQNSKPGDVGSPGDTACRTAGIAAIMSQQPFMKGAKTAEGDVVTIGSAVLSEAKIRLIKEVLMAEVPCADDAVLSSFGLGRSFSAKNGLEILWSHPAQRVSDSQVVDIARNWGGWSEKSRPDNERCLDSNDANNDIERPVFDFMRSIASQVSAVTAVRDAKIAVNFFIGWERLAILIVVTFLVLCLLWQQMILINDERDRTIISDVVNETQKTEELMVALKILRRSFLRDTGRSAPREVLDAAVDMMLQKQMGVPVDRDRLRRASEHELKIFERRRFFFIAGLPLLPTIGFIGTVRSLIEALAIADNIPRARDAVAQVAAVSDVTSTLSLCFSTTFMALSALLIFAPLDLWQGARERASVEETERILDDAVLKSL